MENNDFYCRACSFVPLTRSIRRVGSCHAYHFQVFLATDNSLCQLFHGSAVNQSNDILCEYNVRTAGQLASRIYDMFTAVELLIRSISC